MNDERSRALEALAARRWRIALGLTAAMLATYFGFVLLVAYDKPLMGRILVPGLSLGILLGAPSGGLVDVDIDAPEALALRDRFLPPTRSRFGRPNENIVIGIASASRPASAGPSWPPPSR